MLIQSQDCKQIVMLDNLYVDGNCIIYGTRFGGGDIIGIYKNNEDALSVFNDIIIDYHSDCKISILPLKNDVCVAGVVVGCIDAEPWDDLPC